MKNSTIYVGIFGNEYEWEDDNGQSPTEREFADRIEVWNPGGLPEDLTADMLKGPHPSVPRNRLICGPLYLAHYIERASSEARKGQRNASFASQRGAITGISWKQRLQNIQQFGVIETEQ